MVISLCHEEGVADHHEVTNDLVLFKKAAIMSFGMLHLYLAEHDLHSAMDRLKIFM